MAAYPKTLTCDKQDIPLPIVKLNRWTLLTGISVGLLFQQPLVTTALFLILLPAVLFGKNFSLIYQTGSLLFARQIEASEYEDRRLQRFNNTIALVLLGAAQVSFICGNTILGWAFSVMVATAAGVALLGFCLGCFLYFQFRLNRYKLFGR